MTGLTNTELERKIDEHFRAARRRALPKPKRRLSPLNWINLGVIAAIVVIGMTVGVSQ
ncbi:MAG: hypothetical protein MJH10_10165 [Epibacterium sp.]|nr:hypothetical protein [Epibacterium sp.]NQX73902.1 hypothetical protein [Epibacterium sp.]